MIKELKIARQMEGKNQSLREGMRKQKGGCRLEREQAEL